MNEEEIIEMCKIFIDLYNGDSDWDIEDTKEAIQGLLDLYNQEKEKNKILEEENRYLQDYLNGMEGGLKEQIKEQQKQISELQAEMEE